MASCRVCLQWTVIVFNTLSVIIGIAAVVACVYELEKFTENSEQRIEKYVQMAAACVLVISAFVGCCASIHGSTKVLIVFLVMLICLIVVHIWKLWRYDEGTPVEAAEAHLISKWLEQFSRSKAMDDLQERYDCCGRKGYTDYTNLKLPVPNSCYKTGFRTSFPNDEGCLNAMKRAYLEMYRYEHWANWSLIGFEVFGIVLTIALIYQLTDKPQPDKYRY